MNKLIVELDKLLEQQKDEIRCLQHDVKFLQETIEVRNSESIELRSALMEDGWVNEKS